MADSGGDNNDEIVSQFMAFSGCSDASEAASYLEMSGGDLETAVGLYMEHKSGGGAGASASAGAGMDTVRAPDATQRMQLMDDHHHHGGGMMMMGGRSSGMLHAAAALQHMDPSLRLMHEMMERELQQQQQSAFAEDNDDDDDMLYRDARAAVNAAAASAERKNDDDDDDDVYHYDDDDDDGMEESSDDEVQVVQPPQPERLKDMFAPPSYRFTLASAGNGFQSARTAAKDSKRWLLVNIQRDSEFASHALNRDVWRDELMENLVSEGFIFWQVVRTTSTII